MANKTNLWICGDGISACFHARFLYFFLKPISWFLKGVHLRCTCVFEAGVGIAEFGLSFHARWIK